MAVGFAKNSAAILVKPDIPFRLAEYQRSDLSSIANPEGKNKNNLEMVKIEAEFAQMSGLASSAVLGASLLYVPAGAAGGRSPERDKTFSCVRGMSLSHGA